MPSLDDGGPEVRRDASLPAPLAVQPAHPCAVVRANRSHPVRLPDSRSQRPRLRCDIRVAISHFTPAPLERIPISVPTLEPDVLAPWTIDSWLAGKDPMMDAVTALVDKVAKESTLPSN